jgi:hypothetical protein
MLEYWQAICFIINQETRKKFKNKELLMKIMMVMLTAMVMMLAGCSGYYIYTPDQPTGTVTTTTTIETIPYVDTYLPLPDAVLELIAPSVAGYFSPAESRYSDFLYNQDFSRTYYNRPCFVQADFNGDGTYDYALLFSVEDLYTNSWELTTKLLVVLSTPTGYELSTDMILGTVSADNYYPIEEYWSLCKVPAGTHSYTTYANGIAVTKTTTLEDDGFILAYLDSGEEDLFYTSAGDVYYMPWTTDGLAKKRANATAKISSSWHDKIPMKIK